MKMKLATVKVLSNKNRKVQREARMLRLITMLSWDRKEVVTLHKTRKRRHLTCANLSVRKRCNS